MSPLRLFAWLFGSFWCAWAFYQFRQNRLLRSHFLVILALGTALIGLGIFPDSASFLRDLLALEDRVFSRLLAISIFSNLLLWLFVLYFFKKSAFQALIFDQWIVQTSASAFLENRPFPQECPDVLVIIPALNESQNIGQVLKGLPSKVRSFRVQALVVDDGSTDGTSAAATEAGAWVLRQPIRRGGGVALRTGFQVAKCLEIPMVVTMDGDGQHCGDDLPNLLSPLLDNTADVVIGSRVLGHRERDSLVRWIGIHVFNFLIRFLIPYPVTDCSSGFRAMRMEKVRVLDLRQNQYHTAEFIIEASRKGLSLQECPITIRKRLSGTSKKGPTLSYGLRFLVSIFRTWWR